MSRSDGSSNQPEPEKAVTICVSAQVLFNMETENVGPGPAFSFVKVLEVVNKRLRELNAESEEVFKVVILINDQPDRRQRITDNIETIEDHNLFIKPHFRNDGGCLIAVLKKYHADLYLSADAKEVEKALREGIAAATMFTPEPMAEVSETQLRVAFDGDGVLFSDESENVFRNEGLEQFLEHEKAHERTPMNPGPLKGFLEALGKLQKKFYARGQRTKCPKLTDNELPEQCPIRTYLVTSRGAAAAGSRALITLRSWDLEMDEGHLLSGAPKGPMLEMIRPHIFFDDKMPHVEEAREKGIVACHVPYESRDSS